MSDTPAASSGGLILLDIEGTTTPVAFVTGVLFPYARRHLRSHLELHAAEPEYESMLAGLRTEHQSAVHDGEAVPPWDDASRAARLSGALEYLEWLMDRDRKSPALKALQGRIWEDGYRCGALLGEVFPDVGPALQRWNDRRLQVGIFSSGSVLAQQLLFRHSSAGDLTGLVRWYFDTHVGPKVDRRSYDRIAQAVGMPAENVLFLSDTPRELDAARTAGMNVILVVRPGNTPVANPHPYRVIHSLGEVALE